MPKLYNLAINMNMEGIKVLWKDIWQTGALCLLWISIHYIAVHLYVYFCTPLSLMGYLKSVFLVAMPHCRALNWTISRGAAVIDSMWIIAGMYIFKKLSLFQVERPRTDN